ncbi:inositol-pentakisphosphate 2-kinase-like isoform X3 [Salvia miltiorrhiza]|uniref:inositol-pentakisphosphate 2-kinase-like isoform X3 n=1 Tax=Salvia miltiorrhiza TaxID=226208 RepID=UPI0025AC6B47|nr:inositol-pentakisphosphate 2-kinase-like isoform X3 [Salvia miltiorrhiza]
MAAILQAKDAEEWTYRGEGAVNLVLAYCGSSPQFVGKVLRIQKVPNDGPEFENGHSALVNHESLLWGKFEGIVSAPTKEIAEQLYVQKVMCPLLGSEHVDSGIHVLVSRGFLEAVDNKVLCQRPSWRVDAARVNPLCDSVLLIADHSVFPHVSGSLKEDFCVSVEIKPKGGFLPISEFIAEENAVKKRITRFKMHQALKLHQGKISQISKYDPLDLFSGSKDGIQRAIKALLLTPQNNFRVFLNGSLIFGGMGGAADSTRTAQSFHDGLKHVISAKDGMHVKGFVDLLTETIFKSGLWNRLLEVQKLDAIDIEGAIHAYYDIIFQPCVICRQRGGNKFSARYSSIHSMQRDEKVKIVRDYLISATAKDLSMMISFRSKGNMDQESPYRAVFLESSKQTFCYKASFIDLDMKPLKKMEYYYELDQQIVKHYVQMVKDTDALDCGESTQESLKSRACTSVETGKMAN